MTTIVLIRHAPVTIDKHIVASSWQLSADSQARCQQLANQLQPLHPVQLYTSTEQKAVQTAKHLTEALNIPMVVFPNLHETERTSTQFYTDSENFISTIHKAMRHPDKVIFGDEAFGVARDRLTRQLHILADKHPHETIGIVSHGRILAMFLAQIMKQSPIKIWDSMSMPAYAILSWESMQIVQLVTSID
jgi:broad specificity phosphatase PhoE